MTRLIATFFYAGLMRPAPGTWGSLAALPAGYGLLLLGGWPLLLLATALAFALGLWATIEQTRDAEDPDPSEIVIDEVVGQWIALLPVAMGAARAGADLLALWPGWVAAFALFRLFDIWKPWLVGVVDARGDALGVMLDDVLAGVFAALGVLVLAAAYHGLAL